MNKKWILGVLCLIIILGISPFVLGTNNNVEENIYASYYGGNDRDIAIDIAVNSQGQFIVVGGTFSTDFPILNGFQEIYGGGEHGSNIHVNGGDGFIMKLDSSGIILWSTFIGGSDLEVIEAVEIDEEDNIVICGSTSSNNFPVTDDALQLTYRGGESDGFVAKISNDGDLLYSSYCGEALFDSLLDLKIASNGDVLFLGLTNSPGWSTTENAFQATFGGNYDTILHRFTGSLSKIEMRSYWGSQDQEIPYRLELDSDDNIFITGNIIGDDLLIKNALYDQFGGNRDIFVLKINDAGIIDFCTYLGGEDFEDPFGSTIDQEGNILLSGRTASSNFPVINEVQSSYGGIVDGIVSFFDADGQTLRYSTYLGGSGWDTVHDLSITDSGKIFACGIGGQNFPLKKELQSSPAGNINLVMMVFDENYNIEFSSYYGTGAGATPYVVEGHQGQMVIVGRADASSIRMSDDAAYPTNSGDDDGFLLIFDVESYLTNYIEPGTIASATDMLYLVSFLSIISIFIYTTIKICRK